MKTDNQMLKNGKSAKCNEHQKQKYEVCLAQKPQIQSKKFLKP